MRLLGSRRMRTGRLCWLNDFEFIEEALSANAVDNIRSLWVQNRKEMSEEDCIQ